MHRPRAAWAAGAGALLALALAAGVLRATWDSVDAFVRATDDYRLLFADFVLQYRPAGEEVLRTKAAYPGYYYSPAFALALAPFSRLSESAGLALWGALQVAAAVLLAAVTAARARETLLASAALVVFFTSSPVLHNFKWGQVSVLVTLLVLAAASWRAKRPALAAAALAAATAIKYYPAVFALPALLRRETRFLAVYAAALAALFVVLPASVLGPRAAFEFVRSAAAGLERDAERHVRDVNSQYFPHVVERWTTARSEGVLAPIPEHGGAARRALGAGGLAVAAAALELARRLAARRVDDAGGWGALLLFGAIPFALPTSWPHYLAAVPAMQVAAARELGRAPIPLRVVLGGGLLVPSIFLGSLVPWTRFTDWRTYAYFGGPFLASTAAFVLLAVLAVRRLREAPATSAASAASAISPPRAPLPPPEPASPPAVTRRAP